MQLKKINKFFRLQEANYVNLLLETITSFQGCCLIQGFKHVKEQIHIGILTHKTVLKVRTNHFYSALSKLLKCLNIHI